MTKCKVTCIISLFFLEKKSEIWNAFTLFENWKVNLVFLSLISRMKSEMKIPWDRDREWKVKWKCLEIEIEKWNVNKIPENSRETRLSQVTEKPRCWRTTNHALKRHTLGGMVAHKHSGNRIKNVWKWSSLVGLHNGQKLLEDNELQFKSAQSRWHNRTQASFFFTQA